MNQEHAVDSSFEGLKIGGKIREAREKKSLTLQDLAARTGMTRESLEQIEAGEFVPPVATLLKLARALGVGMARFFEDDQPAARVSITRLTDRRRIARRPHHHEGEVDYVYEALETRKPEKHMEPLFVEFQPLETGDMVFACHDGEEFGYVLEGRREFRTDDRVETLTPAKPSISIQTRTTVSGSRRPARAGHRRRLEP
jgi:transcriptional regulator with XRE-family HTH domain